MFQKLFVCVLAALLLTPAAIADDESKPTVAIARFGTLRTFDTTEGAILDVLESYGWISSEENAILHQREDHDGEKLNVIWGSANFDTPTATLMIQQLLDEEPDALVTLTTTVTQLALTATADMADPPAPALHLRLQPIRSRHAGGTLRQARACNRLHIRRPLRRCPCRCWSPKTRMSSRLARSTISAKSPATLALWKSPASREELGLTVLAQPVNSIADVNLAAERLVDIGIDAFVMPIDLRTGAAGLPIIVNLANEFAIPVFHPILFSIYYGATISSGFYHYYAQGDNVGVMLAHYLNGDLDIDNTGVNEQRGSAIGINLDSAGRQGLNIADDIVDQADAVIRGGEATISERVGKEMRAEGEIIPLADRIESDQAMLDSLDCDA